MFQHAAPPEFSLAGNVKRAEDERPAHRNANSFAPAGTACNESIKLLRENDGVRTTVRFRDGKIIAPIAFTGFYNPFDRLCPIRRLGRGGDRSPVRSHPAASARACPGGKSFIERYGRDRFRLIARMVQGSIDKKINPIEIIQTDKVTFLLPVQNSNGVRMRATGFRHDLMNGLLNVRIAYEFEKVR